jgi:hypothetical protein
VPLVYKPLCWHPSVCNSSNHCNTLFRWGHVNLRSRSIALSGCQGRHPLAGRPGSRPTRPIHRENRAAHSLMPPLPATKRSSGSESGLYAAAYRITRDHLLRVRLSAFAGSAVHRMTAANGSSRSETASRCKRTARRARSTSQMPRSRCRSWGRAFPYTERTAAAMQSSAIAPCPPIPFQRNSSPCWAGTFFQLRHFGANRWASRRLAPILPRKSRHYTMKTSSYPHIYARQDGI